MSSIERVRVFVDPDSDRFSNDQIQVFLDEANGNILMAASYAALALSGSAAPKGVSQRIGDYQIDAKQIPVYFAQLSAALREQALTRPAFAVAEINASHYSSEEIMLNAAKRAGLL